jgi:threonine/homoserine/homoserine lactone efflux protein
MPMTLSGLLLFAGVYGLAVASPGPAIAAIVARSLTTGFARTLPFVAGVVLGDIILFVATVLGLAVLVESFHGLFLAIKYAGCVYLAYLAWKLWTAPVAEARPATVRGEGARLFLGGLALTLGNPKAIMFFLSILPLVVDVGGLDTLSLVEITLVLVLVISTIMTAYAFAAHRARALIASPRATRIANRASGAVMAAAAGLIATRG